MPWSQLERNEAPPYTPVPVSAARTQGAACTPTPQSRSMQKRKAHAGSGNAVRVQLYACFAGCTRQQTGKHAFVLNLLRTRASLHAPNKADKHRLTHQDIYVLPTSAWRKTGSLQCDEDASAAH